MGKIIKNGIEYGGTPINSALFNAIYPIGSVYISVSSTNPASLFGGTWEKIEGKFLLGTSENYELGTTGGEETHILTVNEMPSHTHKTQIANQGSSTSSSVNHVTWGQGGSDNITTTSAGGGQAHNNMPPYLTVNIWKRTA